MKSTKSTEVSCYVGYFTQAIILNLLPLFFVIFQNDYGLSGTKLSFLVFLTFFTQIGIDLAFAFVGERANLRFFGVLAHVLAASGLILLSVLPAFIDPFVGITVAVVIYSAGSAFLEVIINPLFDRLPQKEEKGFSFAHSFYCWGQMTVILLSAIALKFLGNTWRPIPLFWSVVPILNAINLAFAPIPEKIDERAENSVRSAKKRSFNKLSMTLFITVMICAGSAEQSVAQWASYFAERGLGTSKVVGDLLGPCMFAFFMAMGRTLFGMFGQKINIASALKVCALSSAACYLVIAFAPSSAISLIACALSGLTVSLMWPATLDLASSAFYCGTAVFSLLSVAGDLGCTLGPSVNGLALDFASKSSITSSLAKVFQISEEQMSIRLGFALGTLLPIIMLLTLSIITAKILPKKSENSTADVK